VPEPAHSELSPSKRARWGVCPGSIREEAKFPEPPGGNGGPAALDGTRTHTMLEAAIKNGCHRIPDNGYGYTITDQFGTFTVDRERIERLNIAIDYINERVAAAGVTPITETRVYPDGLVNRGDLHGTVDVQIPGRQVYEVIDYKDGMHPVEAKDNPQLEQYALGVLAGLDQDKHPKSFQLTIVQPKLAMRGMPVISTHNVSTEYLLRTVLPTIVAQAAATDDPAAPLVPGESQCKYCRAKGSCSALAGDVMKKVSVMFEAIATTDQALSVAQQAAQKDPTQLSDDELCQILEAAPLLETFIKGVKVEAQRRLEAGIPVPGYKMVQGKGSRGWALPQDEMVKKLVKMGIPKASLFDQKILSPAAIEKLTWEKAGIPTSLSKIQIDRMAKEYVAYQNGKPTMAPESDSRAAVMMNAAPLFDAVIDVVAEAVPAALPPWMTVPAWLV